MLDRNQAPPIKDAVHFDFNLPTCESQQLDNGIFLHAVNSGSQEVFSLELVFDSGTWCEHKPGQGRAASALIKNGTPTKSAFEINNFFEFYGASIKCNIGADFASVSLTAMSKFASVLLPTVAEIITQANYPEHELDIYKKNAGQQLQINLKKCDFVANRLIDEYVFGRQHPYGQYVEQHHIEDLKREDLLDFRVKNFSSKNCRIFLAGNFDETLPEEINTVFGQGNWNQTTPGAKPEFTAKPATQKIYRVENDPNGVQGAVRIAAPFINKFHPDFPKLIVLNTLFGGYFGSRLMSNIREEKGYTYGIHSYMYNNQKEGAFLITTEAGKDVCEAVVDEVFAEVDKIKNEKIDAEELLLVKNYLLGNILGDIDGPFQIIQRWKSLLLSGFDMSRFNNNIQIYKNISADELQSLAQHYFDRDKFYELIVT